MLSKTKKTHSAVTASEGFVQLNSSLTEQFTYTKIYKISTCLNKPILIVSFEKYTIIWDIFSPSEHIENFNFSAKDLTSTAAAEDLNLYCFGNEFGILSIYLSKERLNDVNKMLSKINSPRVNYGDPILTNLALTTHQSILEISIIYESSRKCYRIVTICKNSDIETY